MSRPGFYFCFCPDSNLLKRQINKIISQWNQEEWEMVTLWSDDPELEQRVWNSLNLPNMMGPSRAVVLRRCEDFKEEFWSGMSPALKGYKPGIWPFFCLEAPWKKNTPQVPAGLAKQRYYQIAKQKNWIWQFPGITRQNLPRYLQKRAKELNLTINSQVQEKLLWILPLDSHGIDQELDKLSLLAPENGKIEMEHLAIVESKSHLDIFTLLQKVQQSQNITQVWHKIFEDQQSGHESLFPFLGLLLREARILWHLASNEQDKVSLYPRVKQEKNALAKKLGQENISRLWSLILEAEMGVKSGTILPEQAMENLVANLFQLFGSRESG